MPRFLFALALLAVAASASAQQSYYVDPNGSPLGSGTESSPLNTIAAAVQRAAAGDTIWVHGGTYASSTLRISKSGTDGAYLHIWAVPGETPILDFTGANKGIHITASYLHLKGLTAQNAGDNGIYLTGSAARHLTSTLN